MNKYQLVAEFKGYVSKEDITKIGPGYLVSGSQNIISTDKGTLKTRDGYTLDSAANAANYPIESSFDWDTNTGVERNLRGYDDELEFRWVDGSTVTWTRIKNGWSAVDFQFAVWWDTQENKDILIFVNGDANIYAWSGAAAKIGATTANTIQLLDTTSTWAEERFLQNPVGKVITYDKKITINGTEYTYTGGETTDTLTGVTPDPTGEASGSVAIQTVTTFASKPAADATVFTNDLIKVFQNQCWVGSLINNVVYASKNTDFHDFTAASSPRLPGEAYQQSLDNSPTAFQPQENDFYISAGKSDWYKTKFTLSADLTTEEISIDKMKTNALGAAKSQNLTTKIKNAIAFISNEPTFDSLGNVENVPTPQQKPLSDPIKDDFDAADFTNGDTAFWRNKVYISAPADSKVYIYDLQKGYWEAPQIMRIRKFAIIGGLLYGHSSVQPETYKLFDSSATGDNSFSMEAIAKMSYQNYGDRVNQKSFDEYYSEGRIGLDTDITLTIYYDFNGSTGIKTFTIDGGDTSILQRLIRSIAIGKHGMGTKPIAGDIEAVEVNPKFRQINTMPRVNFYEIQVQYSSNQLKPNFEIISFGPNVKMASGQPINIKK